MHEQCWTWRPASSCSSRTLLVVRHHLQFRGFALAYLGYLTVSCLSALSLATLFIRPKFRGTGKQLRGQIRAAAPLAQCDVLSAAYARADSLMIFFIRGDRAVALYGLAYQVASFLFVVPHCSNALSCRTSWGGTTAAGDSWRGAGST